jgi:hypothetical protein
MRAAAVASLAAFAALGFVPIGPADEADARKRVSMATKTFKMGGPDQKRRLVVRCPRSKVPYGGGMKSSPLPGADGEGAYPHSYERLGVQGGFHVTAVLYDPSHGSTQKRRIQLQVKCGRRLGHMTPPHRTKYVRPGQTKKAVARCPGRRHLIGGGFQRTDFVSRGGNYVTESRAISSKAWRVTASAFGRFGGEITAIAYCIRSKRPLVKAVSASTSVSQGGFGEAATPRCPGKRRLIWGGFGTSPWGSLFFHNGYFTRRGRWASSGYNNFGPTATLTSYGYCL